jgi:hypothetical protein
MGCGKSLIVLTVATLVARNIGEAMVAPVVGFRRSLESGCRFFFCWYVLQESGFGHRGNVSVFNMLYKEIL